MTEIYKDAYLSKDGVYRYSLFRTQGAREPWEVPHEKTVNFVMLNPSTADAELDDPTIRRCMNFAWGWGYEQLVVTNLFALRATNPKELYAHVNPVGPDNEGFLLEVAKDCDRIICAWGKHGALHGRGQSVLSMLRGCNKNVCHLGLNKDGSPRHPLYLKGDTEPVLWNRTT